MLQSRLFLVVMLWIGLTGVGLGTSPIQAQCELGTPGCPIAPARTDCPPGSHPRGLNDCEVDGSGQLTGLKFSSTGEVIFSMADFNFTGSPLDISGTLQESDPNFNRRTADLTTQICSGDATADNINYRAYSLLNSTNQPQTIDLEVTRNSGILSPFLHVYHQSFNSTDPANNCLKAAEGVAAVARVRRFTWQPGQQLVIVVTGFDSGSDEGDFTLSVIPSGAEYEPNDDAANARPISPNLDWISAEINPAGDVDYYRFEAKANQRIWIYVRTDQSIGSQDSVVELRKGNDTVVTSDDNNGGQSANSSAIAGYELLTSGTYLVRVIEQGNNDTITPYYLYLYLSDQEPVVESEFNNNTSQANTYDADNGSTYQLPPQIFQGHQGDSGNGIDFFKLTTPPGSIIFTSLDTDADDNSTDFGATLKLYNSNESQVVSVNSGNNSPRSEALSYGQLESEAAAGSTWYASVLRSDTGANLPYYFLAGYSPTRQGDVIYSTDIANKVIPDGGSVSSTLASGYYCMDNLDVWLDLDHDNLDDLTVSLTAPDNTLIELFSHRGGDDNSLSTTLDDEAGLAPLSNEGIDTSNARIGGRYQTDGLTLSQLYRKSGLGQWTLTISDGTAGNNNEPLNGDVLNSWALIMHCSDINYLYLPIIHKNN